MNLGLMCISIKYKIILTVSVGKRFWMYARGTNFLVRQFSFAQPVFGVRGEQHDLSCLPPPLFRDLVATKK